LPAAAGKLLADWFFNPQSEIRNPKSQIPSIRLDAPALNLVQCAHESQTRVLHTRTDRHLELPADD
jgi:hypothetical protein